MTSRFAGGMRAFVAAALLLSSLSACDTISGWFGDDEEKDKLPGKRIDVLSDATQLKPDDTLNEIAVTVPDAKVNAGWPQAAGAPAGITGNLQVSGFEKHNRVKIGEHNKWEQPLYTLPVVADGMVFVMDAKGYVTAHNAADIDDIKWTNKSAVTKHEPDILGGGLGVDNGHLYITTGRGMVFAVDEKTGHELWRQSIGIPLRAAPKAADGKVYIVSVDNQLFTLDAVTGKQLWNHRGINENAGFLSFISPAVSQSIVIAPYSSGELHALDAVSGQDVWSDVLLKPRRTVATFGFSGIGGNPIVSDDVIYAASSSGFMAAFALQSGRRIWQQDISSLNTVWVAGDFIYVLNTDSQIVCLYRPDGRIKWIKQLQRFENEKKQKDPYFWFGPVMANGTLLVAGAHGEMLVLSPKDGSTVSSIDIPEDIVGAPVIAGGRTYFVTKDARLHVLY